MRLRIYIAILMGTIVFGCASSKNTPSKLHDITPFSCGLSEAKNGIERYWVLYNTHVKAKTLGVGVDYSGVKRVDIEIPSDAKTIPLTYNNDFKDAVLYVINQKKDFFLFELINNPVQIDVEKKNIDNGVFLSNKVLSRGKHLLSVYDNKPWVEKRRGYGYGHIRKDIFLVEKGHTKSSPVMPYNNAYSEPKCFYYPQYIGDVIITNMSFVRSEGSSFKTYLCSIKGVDRLTIKNVIIKTPQNSKDSDQAIRIIDCTNVKFKDLIIDGTYSRKDYSGYGVSMDNIWNFKAINMYGHGNWGVFGTNNVNVASFEECDINRFDIHCYGRDVSFKKVIFRNRYNSFSSVFGTILFNGCRFYDFVPIVGDASYNAHVGYDLVFKDCEFSTSHDTPQLIYDLFLDAINSRPELANQSLPNVTISNFIIHVNDISPNAYLFFLEGDGVKSINFDYLSKISINGLRIEYDELNKRAPADFILFNAPIAVKKTVSVIYEDIDILGNALLRKKNRGRILNTIKEDKMKTYKGEKLTLTTIE